MFEIAVDSGFVSAFYFVILDLFLLTTLDQTLARILSTLYYKSIFRGKPLLIKSYEIPGVANFLLAVRNVTQPTKVLSTFDFNASDAAWGRGTRLGFNRIVQRRWDQSRHCRELIKDKFGQIIITYYALGFNLSNDFLYFQDELQPIGTPYVPINDTTLHCLSPTFVTNPRSIAKVIRCSTLGRNENTSCSFTSLDKRNANEVKFSVSSFFSTKTRRNSGRTYTYSIHTFDSSEISTALPEYVSNVDNQRIKMTCISARYSLESIGSKETVSTCLIIVIRNGTTLFERWEMDEQKGTITRLYPGPIFNGELDIGIFQTVNILWNAQRNLSWLELSSVVIGTSSVYRLNETTINIIIDKYIVTQLPKFAIALIITMGLFILITRFITYFVIERNDERPQLNVIDGISSIGREERIPSGQSMVRGQPLALGYEMNLKIDGRQRSSESSRNDTTPNST